MLLGMTTSKITLVLLSAKVSDIYEMLVMYYFFPFGLRMISYVVGLFFLLDIIYI